MVKRKRYSKNKVGALVLIYWIVAGLATDAYLLNQDKELSVLNASEGLLSGGLLLPVIAALCSLTWLDQNVKIRINK